MTRLVRFTVLAAVLAAGGCKVGPNYTSASAPRSPQFKELAGWKPSAPRDGIDRGAWWSIYNDPLLDSLERRVKVSNQTVIQAYAAYTEAAALTREARAALYPTLAVAPGLTRASSAQLKPSKANTQFSVEGSASWDIDVWGKIRRQVESQAAAAQASAADYVNATLSEQGALATDYFDLRGADAQIQLLRDTLVAYKRALQITLNQYNAGTAARSDVLEAQVQVDTAQAQLVSEGVARAQYEHAIAVLAGLAPSELTIPEGPLATVVPVVPAGLPSALLERRPDISAAERTMQSDNALIGVAVAAYYPDITLSGVFGVAGDPVSSVASALYKVWSIGASASETLFEGGERPAAVQAARAIYDQAVASYRQTVLTAFQQVEDDLAGLRILQNQAAAEDALVRSSQQAVQVTLNEYRAGTVAYTTVITEQEALLSAQQTALTVQQNRLTDSVALIQALGGGWDTSQLPARQPDVALP